MDALIKCGPMIKRSQNKKKWSIVNYKNRWFELSRSFLVYYDQCEGGREVRTLWFYDFTFISLAFWVLSRFCTYVHLCVILLDTDNFFLLMFSLLLSSRLPSVQPSSEPLHSLAHPFEKCYTCRRRSIFFFVSFSWKCVRQQQRRGCTCAMSMLLPGLCSRLCLFSYFLSLRCAKSFSIHSARPGTALTRWTRELSVAAELGEEKNYILVEKDSQISSLLVSFSWCIEVFFWWKFSSSPLDGFGWGERLCIWVD